MRGGSRPRPRGRAPPRTRHPLRRRVEPAPTPRKGQYASGARRSTTSAVERSSAPLEPEPDDHRDEGHRDRGNELERDRRGEGYAERLHRRLAVAVGDRADRARLGLRPAEGHEGGQPLHHVEEVTREGREHPPLAVGRLPVAMPIRAAKTGMSGSVADDDPRSDEVLARDGDDGEGGQHGRQGERGEVAGDIGLHRDRAARRKGGELSGAPPRSLRSGQGPEQPRGSPSRTATPTVAAARAESTSPAQADDGAHGDDRAEPGKPRSVGEWLSTTATTREVRANAWPMTSTLLTTLAPIAPSRASLAGASRGAIRGSKGFTSSRSAPGCGRRSAACGTPSRSSPGRPGRSGVKITATQVMIFSV